MSDNKFDIENSGLPDDFSIDFEKIEEVSRVFFNESSEILDELDNLILKLEQNPTDEDKLNQLFRKVHTIKGSVGAVPGGQLMGSLAHEFEFLLSKIKKEGHPVSKLCIDLFLKSSRLLNILGESLRDRREIYPEELSEVIDTITEYGNVQFAGKVEAHENHNEALHSYKVSAEDEDGMWLSLKQINELLNISGELLVLKNFFSMMNQTVNFRSQPDLFERRQSDFSQQLSKICDLFQSKIQNVRKESIIDALNGLQLIVRQASTELNKNVKFEIIGGELLIDKGLGKDLYESLVHLLRNSIDHGIEDEFERTIHGKSPIGTLKLEVFEKNGIFYIHYSDDGHGLDRDKILERALGKGLVSDENAKNLTDAEIYRFILQAGFSTRDKITTMSGRGVGMEIVLAVVEKYNGKIVIENQLGQGASFKFEIPVPQQIMVETVMLAQWNHHYLAVPLNCIVSIGSCSELQITNLDQLRFCQSNGKTIPLLSYQEILNQSRLLSDFELGNKSAIFIKIKGHYLGLVVDQIDSQMDLVVKSFNNILGSQRGFRGISILADEKIAYIVDPEQLLELMQGHESMGVTAA